MEIAKWQNPHLLGTRWGSEEAEAFGCMGLVQDQVEWWVPTPTEDFLLYLGPQNLRVPKLISLGQTTLNSRYKS